MEKSIARRDREEARKRLRRSTAVRTAGMILILLVFWGLVALAALKWGTGDTAFQKLTNSAWWFSIPFVGVGIIFPFVLGRERMRLLKWWRGEDTEPEES
jgi:succinate dehydrogenase hydrophobic anchor subunit